MKPARWILSKTTTPPLISTPTSNPQPHSPILHRILLKHRHLLPKTTNINTHRQPPRESAPERKSVPPIRQPLPTSIIFANVAENHLLLHQTGLLLPAVAIGSVPVGRTEKLVPLQTGLCGLTTPPNPAKERSSDHRRMALPTMAPLRRQMDLSRARQMATIPMDILRMQWC